MAASHFNEFVSKKLDRWGRSEEWPVTYGTGCVQYAQPGPFTPCAGHHHHQPHRIQPTKKILMAVLTHSDPHHILPKASKHGQFHNILLNQVSGLFFIIKYCFGGGPQIAQH
jgi:hypothetical protein